MRLEELEIIIEEVNSEPDNRDNSDVQSGCWGDTGTGVFC